MKLSSYECQPKKAQTDHKDGAWWYARKGGIDVYVNGQRATINRAKLAEYIRRTTK